MRLWQRIDGCIDNSMVIDVLDGVMETVSAGSCVRDAGWRASALYVGERDDDGWPPREHPLAITLRVPHWEWVLSQLDRWAASADNGPVDDDVVRAMISTVLASE